MPMTIKPTTAIYGLLAIVLVGIIVLLAMGKTPSSELYGFAAALVGGGLGITNPTTTPTATTAPSTPVSAPVAAPVAPAPAPAPVAAPSAP